MMELYIGRINVSTLSWYALISVLMVMVVNEYILRERILPSTREGAGGE